MIEPEPRFSHGLMLDREQKRNVASLWSASSAKGVVATAHYLATAAGVRTLERGGNAIDAAVTAAFALGVCEPAGSGLGGMAMVLVHMAGSGRTIAIPGACRAPMGATPDVVASSDRNRGFRAVAVPTNLAVLRHILKRYGTLKPAAVLEPAIELADAGYPVTRLQHDLATECLENLPEGIGSGVLGTVGEAHPPGTAHRQPALARTFRRLVSAGLEDFYLGEIASEICRDMSANGGFVALEDMRAALDVHELAPLKVGFAGQEVVSLGPPAGGLALLQMLRMASFLSPDERDLRSGEGVARVAAIVSRARIDRKKYRLRTLADGAGKAIELLSDDYARRAVQRLDETAGAARAEDASSHSYSSGETSHLSVIDAAGNAVSMTQSIERSFGSAVMTNPLGFLYNGYLRAFKVKNQRHPHYLRPGAPARSNAAPTIVLGDGRANVCVGSTGSERMASGIFQVLLRLANHSPFEAVHAPRLHCTPARQVTWEEARFPSGFRDVLLRHGFTAEALEPYSFKMGGLQLAVRRDGQCVGVADPRRDGAAGIPMDIPKT